MLLVLLIIFVVILCLIEREIDSPGEQDEPVTIHCVRCGHEATSDLMVCPGCRALLREHCTGCGESKVVEYRHCPWCGNARDEREGYAV